VPGNADIVTVAPSPAFFVAIGAYLVASLLYVGTFVKAPSWVQRAARWVLVFAFVTHGVDISLRGVGGVHPGTSVREALGFLSWIVSGAYLYLSRREGMSVVGAFVSPVSLIVLATARLSPSGEPVPGLSTVGRLHIALATIGVAIFALATAVSLLYLVQERNLKKQIFDGVVFKQSAPLDTLDRIAHRLVLLGFPIFTLSMMLGAFWASQREHGFERIEYPIAIITWIAFGSLIAGRTVRGWRGKRAAVTTVLGFVAALLVLGIYLARRAMT
jgi:ABC-type uncharacterized transport system permease subunit